MITSSVAFRRAPVWNSYHAQQRSLLIQRKRGRVSVQGERISAPTFSRWIGGGPVENGDVPPFVAGYGGLNETTAASFVAP
jgi:hypothetical protein